MEKYEISVSVENGIETFCRTEKRGEYYIKHYFTRHTSPAGACAVHANTYIWHIPSRRRIYYGGGINGEWITSLPRLRGLYRAGRSIMRHKITLTNDFHNTSCVVIPREDGYLSPAQLRCARRKLCGLADCRCACDPAGCRPVQVIPVSVADVYAKDVALAGAWYIGIVDPKPEDY